MSLHPLVLSFDIKHIEPPRAQIEGDAPKPHELWLEVYHAIFHLVYVLPIANRDNELTFRSRGVSPSVLYIDIYVDDFAGSKIYSTMLKQLGAIVRLFGRPILENLV